MVTGIVVPTVLKMLQPLTFDPFACNVDVLLSEGYSTVDLKGNQSEKKNPSALGDKKNLRS